MSQEASTSGVDQGRKSPSRLKKTIDQVSDIFYHPFSAGALQSLPKRDSANSRVKAKRADRIPEVPNDSAIQPLVRDYHSINNGTEVNVRVPKKVATPVKVEAKVWFANERTWISYLSTSVVMSSLSLALYNASKDKVTTYFAYIYALISIAILIYGYAIFQKRLTMISARDAAQFDQLWGPLLICAAMFIAILANFIIRVREMKRVDREAGPGHHHHNGTSH
ncbi:hypothetical protein NliqN6_1538 [Naganishia liquefaciens]|uniref:DUF202 domain-containing protein n=1 Tax=Naganishia liquefaciens TaxID=104408 RepID=A0A8H3YEX1_9TREE|nr:hypothetical protein NliqN6_1538 [Naganishia liquefaciens]